MSLTSSIRLPLARAVRNMQNGVSKSTVARTMPYTANISTDELDCNGRRSYENAIVALNALQSNASARSRMASQVHKTDSISKKDTEKYLIKSGIQLIDLNRLSFIHVAGTKGKGSTCALTEAILRSCDVKTGFFSSPHLIEVNERIQLCGAPITKDKFAKYFWKVYDVLEISKEHEDDMPAYFKFLTVMAFHVFLGENVDVAIMEVGIGGEHDCTNIIQNTQTVAITALGLDHTQILGDTLEQIAWQKSGIIKDYCSVYTVEQPNECIDVLQTRSEAKNAQLNWVPNIADYNWIKPMPINNLQRLNGSLAIQLSYDWIRKNPTKVKNKKLVEILCSSNDVCLEVFDEIYTGLKRCKWPGRFHLQKYNNMRLYIDGAHTMESIRLCIQWFLDETKNSGNKNYVLFNVTGNRDARQMLDVLKKSIIFEAALFAPNVVKRPLEPNVVGLENQNEFMKYWQSIQIKTEPTYCSKKSAKVFESIEESIEYLNALCSSPGARSINILITGSLYMVGGVYELIERH